MGSPTEHGLYRPYHECLTVGEIREYLKGAPDHAPVILDGGGDWDSGYTLILQEHRNEQISSNT